MILKDSIKIRTTPEKVFKWLVNLKEKDVYKAWHPDHADFRWIKGEPFEKGSIVYFEEYFHGELHKIKFLCTKVVPYREIEYRPLFPWSIFMPKSSFIMEAEGESSCIFTATINLRVVPLFSRLARSKIEALKEHMKEEGGNLKGLLEGVKD